MQHRRPSKTLGGPSRAQRSEHGEPYSSARNRGHQDYRLDRDAKRWDRISPGWAIAVDVDDNGNPWVLDSDGKLHVRGARMPGVYPGFRGGPLVENAKLKDCTLPDAADTVSWNKYFNAAGDTLFALARLCDPNAPAPIGPGLEPLSFAEARSVGAGGSVLLFGWDEYAADPACFKKGLEHALGKHPGVEALFCLAPIFTGRLRVPQDIQDIDGVFKTEQGVSYIDFTHPEVIGAYKKALNDLASVASFKERARYFSLGNEVNAYLTSKKEYQGFKPLWEGYIEFCATAAEEIRMLLPRTKVGINWQIQGILGTQVQPSYAEAWRTMSALCDGLFINFYPAAGAPESDYQKDFKAMLALPSTSGLEKPIVLQEVGMPSSSFLGSSEDTQDKFMQFVLEQWEQAGLKIPFLSWYQLYDYLYDETLQVALDPTSPWPIKIKVVTSKYPKTATYYGQDAGPFWPFGNWVAQFFLGPYEDSQQTKGDIKDTDTVYWLNESALGARAFCEYLSTCGLVCANGRRKPAWYRFRDWTKQQRRQK